LHEADGSDRSRLYNETMATVKSQNEKQTGKSSRESSTGQRRSGLRRPHALVRVRYFFQGIIQGVGFRPTVYRCASRLGLTGLVQNRRSEVVAEIQGNSESVEAFLENLENLLPEPARIHSVRFERVKPRREEGFRIIESRTSKYIFPPIPPDLAMCEECRTELLDPQNRRYLYPFITCTQCGPRYSIVEDTPFDRQNTSMVDFPQCPACLEEYTNPEDRRFHSQTNSCPLCGPRLTLKTQAGEIVSGDPLRGAIEALKQGSIIAIQGIGGFHLAVDPSFDRSMEKLRSDKERERKPFALMVKDLSEAIRLCRMDRRDERILSSPESPILILPMREGAPSCLQQVSDTRTLGLMLPYTPLHLLLFLHPEMDIPYRYLVMTSGNLKGEPIITEPDAAERKLAGIADLFLLHSRRILFRTDDSVLRRTQMHLEGAQAHEAKISRAAASQSAASRPPILDPEQLCILRRSRGFVPKTVSLARELKMCTLAIGGDLKNAPAFARGHSIYLSPYIGDLDNLDTMQAFQFQIEKILSLFKIEPERLVFDTHPLYRSTQWAHSQHLPNKVQVQHHHAHILSVMAEHDLEEVLGLSFDGTGYGEDETIWGGEFLYCSRVCFHRLGSFETFALPGGEAAVVHPIRIALSILHSRMNQDELESSFRIPSRELYLLLEMLQRGINSPLTSALGRIFDAGAAVLGLVDQVSYEGEGPIRLEGYGIAQYARDRAEPDTAFLRDLLPFSDGENRETPFRFDPFPLIKHLLEKRQSRSLGSLSLDFHRAVALASLRGALKMRESTEINGIALSGGVFQNMLLRRLLVPALRAEGFEVYTNRSIPPGDGGLAVGQAYYAGR
jgi:hydrogenase maturation protein HypF